MYVGKKKSKKVIGMGAAEDERAALLPSPDAAHREAIRALVHEQHLTEELRKVEDSTRLQRKLIICVCVVTIMLSTGLFKIACQYNEDVTDRTVPGFNATYFDDLVGKPPSPVGGGVKRPGSGVGGIKRRRLGVRDRALPKPKLGGYFDDDDILNAKTTCTSTSYPWEMTDSLYFSFVTLTSIGYGDYYPTSDLPRLYSVALMLAGMGIVAMVIGMVSDALSNTIGSAWDSESGAKEEWGDEEEEAEETDDAHSEAGDSAGDEDASMAKPGEASASASVLASAAAIAPFDARVRLAARSLRGAAIQCSILVTLWIALILLFGAMLSSWVGWTFTDAVYFAWQTATTIGYGDYLTFDQAFETRTPDVNSYTQFLVVTHSVFALAVTLCFIGIIMELYLKVLEYSEAKTARALHRIAVRRHFADRVVDVLDEIAARGVANGEASISIDEARRTLFEGNGSCAVHAAHVDALCAALGSEPPHDASMHVTKSDVLELLGELDAIEHGHRALLSHAAEQQYAARRPRRSARGARGSVRRTMSLTEIVLRSERSIANAFDCDDGVEAEGEAAAADAEGQGAGGDGASEGGGAERCAPCVSRESSVCCICCRCCANAPRACFSPPMHSEKRMCCQCTRTELVTHVAVHTGFVIFCVVSAALWTLVVHVETTDAATGLPVFTRDGGVVRRSWSFAEALYFCMMTISTVGFGDVVPMTAGAKWLCVVWGTVGLAVFSLETALIRWLLVDFSLRPPVRYASEVLKRRARALDSCVARRRRAAPSTTRTRALQPAASHWFEARALKAETLVTVALAGIFAVAILTFSLAYVALASVVRSKQAYVQVLYFVVTFATTVGYGDITPQSAAERTAFVLCAPFLTAVTAALVYSTAMVAIACVAVFLLRVLRDLYPCARLAPRMLCGTFCGTRSGGFRLHRTHDAPLPHRYSAEKLEIAHARSSARTVARIDAADKQSAVLRRKRRPRANLTSIPAARSSSDRGSARAVPPSAATAAAEPQNAHPAAKAKEQTQTQKAQPAPARELAVEMTAVDRAARAPVVDTVRT